MVDDVVRRKRRDKEGGINALIGAGVDGILAGGVWAATQVRQEVWDEGNPSRGDMRLGEVMAVSAFWWEGLRIRMCV